MAARDPLAVLARLRRFETDLARRLLAERLARGTVAAERATRATEAIHAEGAAMQRPGDYGAWLQRGLAERERAAQAAELARRAEEAARDRLAAARAAERAVALLAAERARAEARAAARLEQARLDEQVAAIPPRA